MSPDEFIQSCLPAARSVKAAYGVPVAVLIAQAALESGWGKRVVQNAYFGIKGHAPNGASTSFQTTEVLDGKTVHLPQTFRAYMGFADAAEDYGRYLRANARYRHCFDFTAEPKKFAMTLALAGYATDPNYAVKVLSIMGSHNLEQYDQ